MQGFALKAFTILIAALPVVFIASQAFAASQAGCMSCHQGSAMGSDETAIAAVHIKPHKSKKHSALTDTARSAQISG